VPFADVQGHSDRGRPSSPAAGVTLTPPIATLVSSSCSATVVVATATDGVSATALTVSVVEAVACGRDSRPVTGDGRYADCDSPLELGCRGNGQAV